MSSHAKDSENGTWYLLLKTLYYKVRIKGTVEKSRERSSALPYTFLSLEREPSSSLDYGCQLYFIHIYLSLYIYIHGIISKWVNVIKIMWKSESWFGTIQGQLFLDCCIFLFSTKHRSYYLAIFRLLQLAKWLIFFFITLWTANLLITILYIQYIKKIKQDKIVRIFHTTAKK